MSARAPGARPVAAQRLRLALLLVVPLAILLGGCAGGGAEPSPRAEADARLAVRVKAALLEAGAVDAAAVRVSARDGTVRLDGIVESEDERRRALRAARAVPGVVRAVDGLSVRPP